MNQSKLNELFDNVYEAVDNLNIVHRTDYEQARQDIRDKKYDHMLLDDISDDEKAQLDELERIVRIRHKNYCDAIINVRNVMEHVVNAFDNIDEKDFDKERLIELQEIINELPQCPPESDFLNITDIGDDSLSNDDDDDEIIILSEIDDDLDMNEEPIDETDAHNESQLIKIIEKSKEMKRLEAELDIYEGMKNQSKTEMFAAKDQQLDITEHQQHQRDLFNKLNELKINYRRVKAEVKGMIQEVLPYLNDDSMGKELMELYYRVELDDAIEKSQASKVQSKIPQAPSRIPQQPQIAMQHLQVPQVVQASSRLPQIQFTSNIPQTAIKRPQTTSRIPQIPTRLTQMSTNQPQIPTRIPQTYMKQPDISHRSIASPQQQQHPTQIHAELPRIQTRIPQGLTSQIPRQMSTSNIPRTPSQLQIDVEQYKSKLAVPSSIRQHGNVQNLKQSEAVKTPPRMIQDRSKQLGANLKISESIGNIRKVRARPEAASKISRSNLRSNEMNRLQLRNLTPAQRKNINKQNKIKTEDVAARMLRDAEKALSKLTKGSKITLKDREMNEKEDIQMLISSALKLFFNQLENVNLSHEHKIKILEEKLNMLFVELRRIMTQYRGKSFIQDETAKQRFIDNVLKHFNETQNFDNYREILAEFFKKIPQQKFQIQKQQQQPQVIQQKQRHSTPIATRRPSSARRYNDVSRIAPSSRRPSSDAASKQTKAKVQNQVRNLEKSSLQKSSTQTAIKQKLDKFVETFCKIFILNQKNRRNKFDIWVKTFRANLNPILNDLEAFYKTLPYPEIQKFNREQIEKSLDRLLHQVYEQTRKYELTNVKCKDLIGNEMKKLMEQKHLKNLNASLGVFLRGIKELIESYIEPSDSQQELPSIIQKPQQTTQNRGQQSMLQRLHESNIQRALHRTLMNETDDSVEYPSFNESLLQQVSLSELQSMYKKMLKGKYQMPNVQGTAHQAMMLEKIEKLLRMKVDRGMSKQRDESFLRGRRRLNKSFQFPIHERLAPSSINTFNRIIGSNEILDAVEITDEMLKVLDIVLECCETVDENICKVLMNQTRNEASALDDSLNILVAHIKNLIYNNNVIDYGDELARLDKLHYKIDVDELKSKLGRIVFTKSDCENLLENAFLMQVNESDVAVYAVIEFIKNLRYMEYKYMLKILKGEIRGDIDKIPINAESSHDDLLSTAPSASYLDKMKFIQPICVIKDYNYPHDLIERDILYVACQLTNRNEFETAKDDTDNIDDDDIDDDRNGHMDYLSRYIIQIAQKYQNSSINERDALRIIGQIFYMLPCIPINFYQRFIYHSDNEYFSSIRFNNPSLNTAARIETMALKNRTMCAEDKLIYGRQVTLITDQIERFMFVFDNEIEEIARSFQLLDTRKSSGIKIGGNEISKNGNGILGNPMEIDTKNAIDGKIDNVQLSLVSSQPPVTNVVNEDILKKLDEIDAILDKHLGEVDHFENSKVAKMSLKYELQPNAIKRKNYWQCRGTEIPKWFPGFYSVFPNSSKPIAYSIEQILPHAWRMMAPINYK
ncbi:interaptin-like [Chironomus tepperi]|uniref:interaptin-like n=1 Tax=Chironomus tepperi TaxID=113505 RepID=UPI00391FBCE7